MVKAENDRLIPGEMAERYAELLPGSRIETVPGTGHALAYEQPEKLAAAIAEFIDDVGASKSALEAAR